MIPRINSRGYSFKGVTDYLMHDKKSDTAERVAWTETGNLYTNDIQKAAKVMAWTDIHSEELKRQAGISTAGRKKETGSAYHYSLSWAHGETPEREHQQQMADETLQRLGLADHQYYYVAHNDTQHTHVHVVVNLTHPETGKRAELPLDKNRLQAWALEYERERVLHCHVREENARRRGQGLHTKYQNEKQNYATNITRAYHASDNGKSFVNALEMEGLKLAKGNRNTLVIVDDEGRISRLMRQLDLEHRGAAKTKAVLTKLDDIDLSTLPEANALSGDIKAKSQSIESQSPKPEQPKQKAEPAQQTDVPKEQNEAQLIKKNDRMRVIRAQKQAQYEKRRKAQVFQKRIDEKTAQSFEKWQIAELEKANTQAKADHERVSGWFYRVFARKTYRESIDNIQNLERRLEERKGRFRADIEAFNKNRPEWARNKELKKYGFEVEEKRKADIQKDNLQKATAERIEKDKTNTPQIKDREPSTTRREPAKEQERSKISNVRGVAPEFKIHTPPVQKQEGEHPSEQRNSAYSKEEEGRKDMPEIDNEEAERIWMEFQQIKKEREERDKDIGLER